MMKKFDIPRDSKARGYGPNYWAERLSDFLVEEGKVRGIHLRARGGGMSWRSIWPMMDDKMKPLGNTDAFDQGVIRFKKATGSNGSEWVSLETSFYSRNLKMLFEDFVRSHNYWLQPDLSEGDKRRWVRSGANEVRQRFALENWDL